MHSAAERVLDSIVDEIADDVLVLFLVTLHLICTVGNARVQADMFFVCGRTLFLERFFNKFSEIQRSFLYATVPFFILEASNMSITVATPLRISRSAPAARALITRRDISE